MKNFALILMSLLMVCCTKDDEVKAATLNFAEKQTTMNKMYITINSVRSDAESGVYYSLNGQQVEKPTKGIYIRNGKKVIL